MNYGGKLFASMTIGLILIGMTVMVEAAPSMSGSTGMIRIPTADSLRLGQFSAGYYSWDNQSVVSSLS